MKRRRFLTALAATGGPVAGCLTAPSASNRTDAPTTGRTRGADTVTPVSLASLGFPGEICSEPTKRDPGIYAVTDPAFGPDWSGRSVPDRYVPPGERPLDDDWTVIGLEREGRTRAYPLALLWHHEVVNDTFGGPVLVTYCSICRSGMVASRVVDGRATTFGVTGLLWAAPRESSAASAAADRTFGADRTGGAAELRHSGNVVVYDDATLSYWSQILAEAICGPSAGETLAIQPSTVATWGEWREANPDTEVLLPPPHSGIRRENPPIVPGDG